MLTIQSDDLLLTKLMPPRPHASLVQRADLFARLNDGVDKKLTIVTAPTGFGKTTLVSLWLAGQRAARPSLGGDSTTAWVTLDEADNDPVRFWRYTINAFRRQNVDTGKTALALLRVSQIPSFEPLLTSLLNDLAHLPGAAILVLDDFHLITGPEVLETFQFLVEHLPPNLHILLLGRAEPALPLALLRARGEINALHADDLRFSKAEIAVFLQQVLKLSLSSKAIQRLTEKTEGWAAGIRLVALAMQNANPVKDEDAFAERFIELFNGEHRYVLEYLRKEVFEKLPESIRDFLQRTCFLSRLCGPLCDAILETSGSGSRQENLSQDLLEQLERASLFVTRLGTGGGFAWYHYQSLFAEAVRYEARQTLGEPAVQMIYDKASLWYEQHGLLEEAIASALSARGSERAVQLIEQFIEQRSFNEILVLRRWCEQAPVESIHRHPLVAFNYALALLFSSDRYASSTAQLVAPLLQSAEDTWRGQGNEAGVGQVLTIRGIIAWWQGDLKAGFEYTHQALEYLAESDVLWRGIAQMALGYEAVLDGNLAQARNDLLEARALSGAANNLHNVLASLNILGEVNFQEGDLEQASLNYRQVLDQAVGGDEMLDDQSIAWLGLGQIAYERNDLQTAEEQARRALELSTRRLNEAVWVPASVLLAWIAQVHGEPSAAQDQLQALLPRIHLSYSLIEVWMALSRLALGSNDLTSARSWHGLINSLPESPYASQRGREAALAARLALAEDRPHQALAQLQTCRVTAQAQGRLRNEVEILCLMAQALEAQANRAQAIQVLTVALTLAQPRGLRRIFLDESELLARLLQPASKFPSRGLEAYAAALLQAFPARDAGPSGILSPADTPPNALLVEPLSAQEIRVLRLVAAGRSNPEIAEELVVSVNTIKTQVQSIYRKLNVNSRQEARDAARAFNLI